MNDSLSIAVHAFYGHVLIPFLSDDTLLPKYVNMSTSFREPTFCVWDITSLIKAYLLQFVCVHMEAYAVCSPLWTMLQGIGLGGCIC